MSTEAEVPTWAWVVAASVGGPLVMKVLDALFSRVVQKEDARAAQVDRKLEELSASLANLREWMQGRFDEMNARREADSRSLLERLHELERELPDRFRKAKHDAINELSPQVGRCNERLGVVENRLTRLETYDERLHASLGK